MAAKPKPVLVLIETGKRTTFAAALDWPGWARSAKDPDLALEQLGQYASRYREAVDEAGIPWPARLGSDFEVAETVPGSGTTDFGIPGATAELDSRRLTAKEAARQAALVEGAWRVFDRVSAGAPAELRKGPRGGGRDRDKMIAHVIESEQGYSRLLGIKHPPFKPDDEEGLEALRADILEVLRRPSDGSRLAPKGWMPRYAARRIAWHALDHAWEMQDRSE